MLCTAASTTAWSFLGTVMGFRVLGLIVSSFLFQSPGGRVNGNTSEADSFLRHINRRGRVSRKKENTIYSHRCTLGKTEQTSLSGAKHSTSDHPKQPVFVLYRFSLIQTTLEAIGVGSAPNSHKICWCVYPSLARPCNI